MEEPGFSRGVEGGRAGLYPQREPALWVEEPGFSPA